MAEGSASPDLGSPELELERYRKRCSELEARNAELEKQVTRLESENRELREEFLSLKTTVSAVVARSIGAKAETGRSRLKKPGRRVGHQGASRTRPAKIDATVELDQSICPRCGGVLSQDHTDSYTRVVEDIVPARVVVIRKITNGNQSEEGARAHAVLMSIRETCALRKDNFFDYAMNYLSQPASER